MKTIKELRNVLKFFPEEINSSIKHFAENCKIDFDVFLPSIGINLQRKYVWTVEQKRELIWSILMHRNIPRMAMINTADCVYQVIDGKQRLSSMIEFYNNQFTLIIDNKEYLFKELPTDYQTVISGYMFSYLIVNEDFGNTISDVNKMTWFNFINFAGTPQDAEHKTNIRNELIKNSVKV